MSNKRLHPKIASVTLAGEANVDIQRENPVAPYEPTQEERGIIQELETFVATLKAWRRKKDIEERGQVRTYINRNVEDVAEYVRLAGCRQALSISPPAITGGHVMQNVDPFNYLFEQIYGEDLHSQIFDMIDKTIGVLEKGKFLARREALEKARGTMGPISGKKVFLVHGHDESLKQTVARFLEKLQLEVVILHEQPSAGKTIIEKVEHFSEVAFAVVLLTPDDVGGVQAAAPNLRPRARQNVILELGYFLGKLERSRVATLLVDEVEKPSDFDGVLYIPKDDNGAWKMLLAKELKEAGLDVDLNDII